MHGGNLTCKVKMKLAEKTIFAIVYSYLKNQSKNENQNFNFESRFVMFQLQNLPWFLHIPFVFLIFLFNIGSLIFYLKPFLKLSQSKKIKYLQFVEELKIPPFPDFIKFFKSLSFFAYYSKNNGN